MKNLNAFHVRGCSNRTYIDDINRKVFRKFEYIKKDKLEYIERITEKLVTENFPIETSEGGISEIESGFVVKYKYYDLACEDFHGDVYSPDLNSNRLKNVANLFADFQSLAMNIKGPAEPLDYPFCNTLRWIYDVSPLESLLGTVYKELYINGIDENLIRLSNYLEADLENLKSTIEETHWCLCHGDFHSSNILFQGDEVAKLIDFGYWINHPIDFDLAIALEFCSRKWDSDTFQLDISIAREFIRIYKESRGPITNFRNVKIIMPYAKLWSDASPARKKKPDFNRDLYNDFIEDRILCKLEWYEENLEKIFE